MKKETIKQRILNESNYNRYWQLEIEMEYHKRMLRELEEEFEILKNNM